MIFPLETLLGSADFDGLLSRWKQSNALEFFTRESSKMAKAGSLTAEEKTQIRAYADAGMSHRKIAEKISRSQNVVSRYLKDPKEYDKKKKRGIIRKLSQADKRRICRMASNSALTRRDILKTKVKFPSRRGASGR